MFSRLINSKKFTLVLVGMTLVMAVCLLVSMQSLKVDNVNIMTESAINVMDERELVGFSDNVFIGKVVGPEGKVKLGETPETQYKVEVLSNIKGELEGSVIVNCLGGEENGVTYTVDNNKPLKEGNTYIFVTRYNEEMNWYTAVPVHGEVLVENEEQKEKVKEKLEKGFKNQIEKFKDRKEEKQ
ncbi:MAG: hypothetical protein ACOYWZ_18160 [Bacillota bacterium]